MEGNMANETGPPEGLTEAEKRNWWMYKRMQERAKTGQVSTSKPGVTRVEGPTRVK